MPVPCSPSDHRAFLNSNATSADSWFAAKHERNRKHPTPYPRLGEIYRALAVAVDTKAGSRNIDRLAREGEFDWSLLPILGEEIVVQPLARSVDPEFAELVADSIGYLHAD